ncbi:DUF2269 family protein [Kallotenue papyrolyticum]|uniref:DUF2269 family protein n=1 Tax=Kallotenue papyrolyticum TaxID=1325125 RepID=UPI0004AE1693|nr:DUF2269 family protein [Kallotenue papyrolyticum]
MVTAYTLFKFLHIVGAIGWLGGFLAFSIISTRSARKKDAAVLAARERLIRVAETTLA